MATAKRKSAKKVVARPPVSSVIPKAQLQAHLDSLAPGDADAEEPPSLSPKRVDSRRNRKRDWSDIVDDFEMTLIRHGINIEDLQEARRQYTDGTRTKFTTLAKASLEWWIGRKCGLRRVTFVDPVSGYTERTAPKFSTFKGHQLQLRGLASYKWVASREDLLAARAWRKRMLSLTPLQRLSDPEFTTT
jgi:hypothetical protein